MILIPQLEVATEVQTMWYVADSGLVFVLGRP